MERFTISLDDTLASEFDALIALRGYQNRSEAVRDILRAYLERLRTAADASGHCVASLSYVYKHHERDLVERLTRLSHQHHDLTVSTMHAHLDHENCIETVLLKGPLRAVRAFADAVIAERGVRHGVVNVIGVDIEDAGHGEPGHRHLRPHH